MKQVRARILIEGRLQGINFRYQTQQTANELDLAGFVRNLSDGRVEIEVQGREDAVEKMIDWCQEKPHSNQIKSILFRYDEPIKSYTDFMVR